MNHIKKDYILNHNIVFFLGLVIIFSLPSLWSNVYSETDFDFSLQKGNDFLINLEYEKAITHFDKILEENPENVDALYAKGNALLGIEKYDEAITLFAKIQKIDPSHLLSKQKLESAAIESGMAIDGINIASSEKHVKIVNGFVELILRDSQGQLILYQKTPNFWILDHSIAKNMISQWEEKTIVSRDNSEFEVFQHQVQKHVGIDSVYGQTGIKYPGIETSIWLTYAKFYHYPVENGDNITFIYSVFKPLE